MIGNDLPALDIDIQNLLAEEQGAPAMPDAMAARIEERLAISIAGVPLSAPDAAAEAASDLIGPTAEASTGMLASLASKPLLIAAAAFTVGIGTGVGGTHYLSETNHAAMHQPAITRASAPIDAGLAALQANDAASPPSNPDEPEVEARALPKRAAPKKDAAPAPTRDRGLAAERALIELSRTAITRRDATTALAHLGAHRTDFPNGRLAEEREALRVQAHVLDHAYTKAKAEAQAFEARYPKSVFLPVVRRVISEIR